TNDRATSSARSNDPAGTNCGRTRHPAPSRSTGAPVSAHAAGYWPACGKEAPTSFPRPTFLTRRAAWARGCGNDHQQFGEPPPLSPHEGNPNRSRKSASAVKGAFTTNHDRENFMFHDPLMWGWIAHAQDAGNRAPENPGVSARPVLCPNT